MCAIGGTYLKPNTSLDLRLYLQSMIAIQHHRGPDAQGEWYASDNSLGLCHNRLAILDLSQAGNQPMVSTDGRYIIVFNGEIYNYKELRFELESKGSCFFSHSDTEVLIEAYRYWAEEMLEHLRGMFAFAIYDQQSQILFCARDKVGKKPFVYAETKFGFVFASEIPAVRQVEGVDRSYHHDAIAAMLLHNLRHIPDPHTAYCGIKRLRAGHALLIKQGRIKRMWRYWTPTPLEGSITPKRLNDILKESVTLRMQADVPVGALLSGGVDSSAIVSLMKQHSNQTINTYTLGFDENDDDIHRARKMANLLGTNHKEFYFNAEKQWQVFNKLIGIYGEPIMLLPLIHTYILCQEIKNDGIKVVLTGNGADELFYGYLGHLRILKISNWLDKFTFLSPMLKSLSNTKIGWAVSMPRKRKAIFYRSIAKDSWANCISKDGITKLANYAEEEISYWGALCPSKRYIDESNFVGLFVENTHSVTTAGDLPAMASSVEVRAPFLDQEIVSFALAATAEMKIPDINNADRLKAILRDAVKGLMPESLLQAPKRGFGTGIQEKDVLRDLWRHKVSELLQSPNTMDGLLDERKIMNLWKGFISGGVSANVVAKQLAIQIWLQGESCASY